MLKKKFRGLTKEQVSDLFSGDTRTVANRFFRLRFKSTSLDHPQFVVITTPTLHQSAVMRNSIRRKVYELIRLQFMHWTLGFRVAILVKKPALEAKHEELKSALSSLLRATTSYL